MIENRPIEELLIDIYGRLRRSETVLGSPMHHVSDEERLIAFFKPSVARSEIPALREDVEWIRGEVDNLGGGLVEHGDYDSETGSFAAGGDDFASYSQDEGEDHSKFFLSVYAEGEEIGWEAIFDFGFGDIFNLQITFAPNTLVSVDDENSREIQVYQSGIEGLDRMTKDESEIIKHFLTQYRQQLTRRNQ